MLTLIRKSKGVLGMNARNIEYIRPYNRRGAVRLADNKLRTKEALFKAGIPVPKMYGIARNRKEVEAFKWADLPKSFVLKPNHGRGGEGIKIIYGQKKDLSWVSTEGGRITIRDLQNHIINIFDGFYSLSGIPDVAFFEERVKLSKTLKPYSYKGIPDIRVIVHNKIPVMAMLRLPTKESGGKANLHLGGIGVGIDVATGVTTHAIMHDQTIEKTPDTKLTLSGIKIPYWREILEIAIKCQDIIKLGYIGVDVAIDRDFGPVVLEVNARPGLSIQNANLAPLKYRLQKVKGLKVKSETHGIRIAQDLFGGEIQQEIEEISGRRILGIIETIKIKYNAETGNQKSEIRNWNDKHSVAEFVMKMGENRELEEKREIGNWKLGNKNEIGSGKLEKEIETGNQKLEIGKKHPLPLSRGELASGARDKKEAVVKEKEMELKAKIDTGADLSSMDKNLAKELGYGAVIGEFDEAIKSLIIDKNATKEKLDEKIKDKLAKWGENFDTVVIKSSHGVSYRLMIKMSIVLSGVEIISKMSITDRSHLEFPVIIGRKDLKRFLVDPSKKTKAVFGK